MPVRLLNSSVHKWPRTEEVLKATKAWSVDLTETNNHVIRVGVFGSYGRGEGGVGSDLDLVIIVGDDLRSFEQRMIGDPLGLPLPADVLIYTLEEWRSLKNRGGHFIETLKNETRWLVNRSAEIG